MLYALVLSGRAEAHLLAHIRMSRLLYSQPILLATRCYNGLGSPGPQYSTSFSCFNYRLNCLIVKRNKARNGLILDERTGVYRTIVCRCGAVGGGVLLLKLVKVVVLS